ncbi:MAG: Gluconeogenesis factor [Marinobacterium sp. xm-d-530]|nr:MAG: Gluconeogenesis factor [Marinobacterium sp. xm-d-530]
MSLSAEQMTAHSAEYESNPDAGPKLLFFSGGTALNGLSQVLKRYTHNSIHLVTPFDSGGSSAVLREAFDMPAVGDLRSRMMALADASLAGYPEVTELFAYRLPTDEPPSVLRNRVEAMQQRKESRVQSIPEPIQSIICDFLNYFLESAPKDFDFRRASIGNLILAGGYLSHNRSLDPIALLFSRLIHVRGQVRTITDECGELKVTTESGREIIGQHLMTGKESQPLNERITSLDLLLPKDSKSLLADQERSWINSADLIVFPPGSFYSSILANLLPKGVGKAIMDNPASKVYVPNLGNDPEQFGMTLQGQIEQLERFVARDAGVVLQGREERCIDILLTDATLLSGIDAEFLTWLDKRGIQFLNVDLANLERPDRYDEIKLAEALLSLA